MSVFIIITFAFVDIHTMLDEDIEAAQWPVWTSVPGVLIVDQTLFLIFTRRSQTDKNIKLYDSTVSLQILNIMMNVL